MAASAALFDLDGTFADTAPDLAAALNRMREEQDLEPLEIAQVRPFASAGARGMVHVGFGAKPGDAEYDALREEFLEYYGERPCIETRLFPGMQDLVDELEGRKIPWGIVTNKALRFTEKILNALDLEPSCVVGGDSTPHLKPHPASLLLAAEQLRLAPAQCWYAGDDLRDIQAARAAGMRAVAVQWGYHHPDSGGPHTWQADAIIARPEELVGLIMRE